MALSQRFFKLYKSSRRFSVANLSFSVAKGEGPSGSGKFTTMKTFTGEISKNYGKVYVDRVEVLTANLTEFTGYCPKEDLSLWPTITVKEHLETYAIL